VTRPRPTRGRSTPVATTRKDDRQLRAHHVHVEHDFAQPVDRVFAYMSEHENLETLFGAKIKRLCDGVPERNGVGSRRQLKIGPLPPFEETITEYVPNERIVYRITKGTPLRNHKGDLHFSALPGGGTHLDYRIRLGSPVPGLTLLVKTVVARSIVDALPQVDASA
jgi:uncharacterized protein YndB with AHSA1/START domain